MITADLFSSASPATVLAALRAHAGEWRQSHIPQDLWRDGVATIECRVRRATCTVTCLPVLERKSRGARACTGSCRTGEQRFDCPRFYRLHCPRRGIPGNRFRHFDPDRTIRLRGTRTCFLRGLLTFSSQSECSRDGLPARGSSSVRSPRRTTCYVGLPRRLRVQSL